ncbi:MULTISPECIES: ferritin-like domain-containing protein [Arthrobacter]|uniref:Uncharacterized protein n=1 Tax=Arthrobacter psychrochitiniphilus TaxID=291045 RepID=A0A2V3DV22_9MICC|nr:MULTISPECIES: DUF892 family protein [Arthrobacter]NYG16196.1 ferritin-like metal-binding protein YciE [Arthrobacter psychrochitiniphilus]PXA64428.1 hypothetical protein CVS29_14860 [Arthrobacter psychrochitiniphilus]
MFERFTTLDEIFCYKLGTALTMEHDSLDLMEELSKSAMRSVLTEFFDEHAQETRLNIENLEQCLALMGKENSQHPSPTTKGLAKELKSFMAKTDNTLVDAVVVAGALESQHHEVAVYESLLLQAKSLDVTEAVPLLSQNYSREQLALEKLRAAADTLAQADARDQDGANGAGHAVIEVPPYLPPGSV